jgi:RNA polymerase sigma-70 factor (ECF subfamily)
VTRKKSHSFVVTKAELVRVKSVADPRLQQLRQGNLQAFQQVHDRYAPQLYRFLHRLCGDPSVAQDLLQDTWLAFARHASHLDQDTDLAAWLFTVARNRHRSWRRWNLFDRLRRERLQALPASSSPGADASYAQAQTQALVEQAILQLSPTLREVLLLVVIEGFEPAQVASILDIRPDAVRQRLSRARAQLAHTLASKAERQCAPERRPSQEEGVS